MSRRGRTRRKTSTRTYCESDEDEDFNFSLAPLPGRKKTKKSTPKKQQTTATRAVGRPKKTSTVTSTKAVNLLESDDEEQSYFKKIQSETLDDFFKSKQLVSDSEDDEVLSPKKNGTSVKPVVKGKDFYTISDSDEEVEIVKKVKDKKPESPVSVEILDESKPSTSKQDSSLLDISDIMSVDDIMADVDKIAPLQPDKNKNVDKDSIGKMMEDCEDVLENVAKLIGMDVKPRKVEESPTKMKSPNCPICLDDLADRETLATVCGHLFCKPCITAVVESTNKKCPTCRKSINRKKIHPVYF